MSEPPRNLGPMRRVLDKLGSNRTLRMEGQIEQADWYYVGHYGQLGPLTLSQMQELASDGVLTAETYVWRNGMGDWVPASRVAELKASVGAQEPVGGPPAFQHPTPLASQATNYPRQATAADWRYLQTHAPKSDKQRVAAGVLNLFLPGVGRMYLGFAALGVLQLFVAFITCGVGTLWSFFDGIYILSGGVKMDGYGRRLDG